MILDVNQQFNYLNDLNDWSFAYLVTVWYRDPSRRPEMELPQQLDGLSWKIMEDPMKNR